MSERRLLRVLGPTLVETDGERRPVRGHAGNVACILASRYPRAVATDVMAEALWPNRPVKESRSGLRVALHRLRQLLGDPASVVHENDGYRLALEPGEIDRVRFEDIVGADDPDADEIERALGLWQGEPYEPFDDTELLVPSAKHLGSIRLDAEERQVELLLAEGRADQAAMRASILVDQQLYRERRWELLMMALYQAGRQREALDVADRARTRLREDLGIEPGPALASLAVDILNHADHLRAPTDAAQPSVGVGDLVQGLRALDNEVPRTAGSFVGREDEVGRAVELLESRRCVTIVGPPGAGKTRLAQRIVPELSGRQPVWLDLVGVSVDSLVARLAGALGLASGTDVAHQIAAELSDQPSVLVLDNAEHLVEAIGDTVEALLNACNGLVVLVTSRHRLGRPFETPLDLNQLDRDDAALLLAQRAYGSDDPTTAQLAELHEAVDHLERFPLHIELLAPLLRERSLDEALTAVATAARGDALDRHASLSAAIDWSVRVLSPPAKAVHDVLGVFGGYAELGDVAVAVDLDEQQAGEALAELVRHSLVLLDRSGRVPMYRQLVGVGEHARSELALTGRLDDVERRHSNHFRSLALELGERVDGPDEEAAVERLRRAMPQLELARQRFLISGDVRGVADISIGLAPNIVLSLDHARYHWMGQVVALPGVEALDDAVDLLSWAALTAWSGSDVTAAAELCDRVASLVASDEELPVAYHLARANALAYEGSLDERTRAFVDLWTASEQRGTMRERATVASMMTLGYAQLGDVDAAAATARRAMRLAREVGNPSSIAWAEFAIGWSRLTEDPTAATRSFLSVVRITRTVRSRWLEGLAIAAMATAALRGGRPDEACRLLPDVLRHLGQNRAFPQLARAGREGVIALAEIGRHDLAGRLLARVELLAPVHPLFDDDQQRYEEIEQRLSDDRDVFGFDGTLGDPSRSWVEMASILDELAPGDLRV